MTGRLPRGARRHWAALDRSDRPPPPAVDAAAIAGLPEPARRWLERAVPPGTPAWSVAELSMRGEIRLGGSWRAFSARQLLVPGAGFVWATRGSTACSSTWSAGPDPDTAVMSWVLDGVREDALLRVDPEGRLRELSMQRWGDPDGTGFGRHPFGVALSEETDVGGVRVPTVLRAGWAWGTDRQAAGEFFRARIEDLRFR